jgi:hypothetical protein
MLHNNKFLYYCRSDKTLVANTSWTVTVEQDENGNLLLPFPPDLLSQMGWSEGTDLFWIDNENGTFSLKEKKNDEPSKK